MRILKLDDIFEIEVAKTMQALYQNNLPVHLANLHKYVKDRHICTTRETAHGNISIPKLNKNITKRSLKYLGAKIWNSIQSKQRQLSK